jgi:DNA-binding NarL/FixJ family response regulator
VDRLSPRLRQTLACLLEGDGEKQISARLGLRPSTVHEYVTALYRHFGVRSRGQLLALVIRRLGRDEWRQLRPQSPGGDPGSLV